jgi:hypothetical protein
LCGVGTKIAGDPEGSSPPDGTCPRAPLASIAVLPGMNFVWCQPDPSRCQMPVSPKIHSWWPSGSCALMPMSREIERVDGLVLRVDLRGRDRGRRDRLRRLLHADRHEKGRRERDHPDPPPGCPHAPSLPRHTFARR